MVIVIWSSNIPKKSKRMFFFIIFLTEPMPHMGAGSSVQVIPTTGQKSWKRPSSAAESERRLVESRRAPAVPQTLSGSDGEKDRR